MNANGIRVPRLLSRAHLGSAMRQAPGARRGQSRAGVSPARRARQREPRVGCADAGQSRRLPYFPAADRERSGTFIAVSGCARLRLPQPSSASLRPASAFTLMELLIVLAIMGLLAAIALPAMKGLQKSNTIANATQQLTADLALARQTAIRERTTVHVVFVPPTILTMNYNTANDEAGRRDSRQWANLLTGAYSTYALFAERTVGDQPGQRMFRYLTGWRTLPDGMFIAEWEFDPSLSDPSMLNAWFSTPETNRPFKYILLPFPTVGGLSNFVPHIAFDEKGSVLAFDRNNNRDYPDEVINLSRC